MTEVSLTHILSVMLDEYLLESRFEGPRVHARNIVLELVLLEPRLSKFAIS